MPAWKAAGGPVESSPAASEDVQRSRSAARGPAAAGGSLKYKAQLKKDKV